jgi:hypothetical protein
VSTASEPKTGASRRPAIIVQPTVETRLRRVRRCSISVSLMVSESEPMRRPNR